jgi:thiamine transporter
MSKTLTQATFVEVPIVAALGFILGFIPIQTGNAAIDLSLGLIPLAVFAIRRGALPAIIAGFIWAMLNFIFGKAYILNAVQFIIEYPLAFSFAGFLGLFSTQIKTAIKANKGKTLFAWIVVASVVGAFARWFWHFIAGVVFWGSYAPKGMPVVLYSLSTNGVSFIANAVMLILVLTLLLRTSPRLFFPQTNGFHN